MGSAPVKLGDVDWAAWRPTDIATLVFVLRGGEVLLMRKKRGLGAGKINGPGGRVEAGETPLECAARETFEELRVHPTGLQARGVNRFQFADGYAIEVHVFVASGCEGEAEETDEAIPRWTALQEIPWESMWEDDELWLPAVIRGKWVEGRFLFDGDRMLDHALVVAPDASFGP